jgi:short chain dehydrogenase
MMRQGWGRIVNVTTSLGTMLNAGSPTYGPSKAALEAPSAIMAKDLDGTGVTVNVLVPGGITNTPMVSESGFDRAKMIQPEVMAPPLVWLVSDAAGKVTGRRFLGVHWDPTLPPEEAAEKAGALVAWTSIATMPITPSRSLRKPEAWGASGGGRLPALGSVSSPGARQMIRERLEPFLAVCIRYGRNSPAKLRYRCTAPNLQLITLCFVRTNRRRTKYGG